LSDAAPRNLRELARRDGKEALGLH